MSRIIKSYELKAAQGEMRKKSSGEYDDKAPSFDEGAASSDWEAHRAAMEAAAEADFQAAYDELISAAQDEVALMLQDAREQANRVESEARCNAEARFQKAYEEGYQLGINQARDDVTGIFEKAQAEVEGIVRSAQNERDRLLDEAEPKMYKLAMDIAQKILALELDRNDEAYLSMLGQALANIRTDTMATIRVSPEEYVRFFNDKKATMQTPAGPVEVDIVNDNSIPPHGALIESDAGTVDAGMDAQLSQIAESLGFMENDE